MSVLDRLVRPPSAPATVRITRWAQGLRADASAVLDALRGRHAPPTITRKARRPAPAAPRGATAIARALVIAEVRRETADAVTLVLTDPTGAPIGFRPGQFFTLLIELDGELVRRAYSACSSYLDPTRVAITVKRVAGGRVSNHLNDRAAVGDPIRVLGPSGDFGTAPDPAQARHVVLIGGGSGITPLMAIARGVLAVEPASKVTLLYGNRRAADIILASALDALVAAHPALTVRHVLEEPDPCAVRTGRLDEATVASLAAELGLDATAEYFVCGPEPMMAAAKAALIARSIPATRIHEERFASVRATPVRGPQLATIRIAGKAREVTVPTGGSLLDAGLDAGLAMPFSCAMGGCGACAVELVSGAVDLDEPNCLGADERARGTILACVARPLGPCVIAVPA